MDVCSQAHHLPKQRNGQIWKLATDGSNTVVPQRLEQPRFIGFLCGLMQGECYLKMLCLCNASH